MAEATITVLDQLDQLEEIVLEGSRIPFSGGRLVNEQDAIEVMDALREALPTQLSQAVDLIRQREEFIGQARQQADEIIATGKREREQVAQAEQEHQARMAQMEQQFAARRQQLEQEAAERNRQLLEQHERNRQQAMAELEQVRQEGMRVQRDSQVEAERLHNDALQFRQQTQQQCDALVSRSRQEAATIQEGANRYAEQVLGELEGRLKEMSQVVLGGRRELVRLQAPDATLSSTEEPVSRRRRVANTLKQLAG